MLEPMDQFLGLLAQTDERCKLLVGNISYNKTLGKTVRRRYKQLIIAGNGFIITWILHQIIMYSDKVKLVAG